MMERIKNTPQNTFVLLGLILGALYWFMGTAPDRIYSPQIANLDTQIIEQEKKLHEAEEKFQNKAKFQAEVEQLSVDFRKALEYLPKEADVQDLVRKISKEARASDLDLTNYKPSDSLAKDFYDELPMEISFKGSFAQLMQFLDRITKIPRIININKISIASPVFDSGQPRMEMTGILVGYRYKEAK